MSRQIATQFSECFRVMGSPDAAHAYHPQGACGGCIEGSFQCTSLAHETACLLRDIGDLDGSRRAFRRSVRTRKVDTFSRTHAVTLGYLCAVQAHQGSVEEACATWSQTLDAMDGVQSGRARDTMVDMRRVLSPFRKRGISAVTELDERARRFLGRVV